MIKPNMDWWAGTTYLKSPSLNRLMARGVFQADPEKETMLGRKRITDGYSNLVSRELTYSFKTYFSRTLLLVATSWRIKIHFFQKARYVYIFLLYITRSIVLPQHLSTVKQKFRKEFEFLHQLLGNQWNCGQENRFDVLF